MSTDNTSLNGIQIKRTRVLADNFCRALIRFLSFPSTPGLAFEQLTLAVEEILDFLAIPPAPEIVTTEEEDDRNHDTGIRTVHFDLVSPSGTVLESGSRTYVGLYNDDEVIARLLQEVPPTMERKAVINYIERYRGLEQTNGD